MGTALAAMVPSHRPEKILCYIRSGRMPQQFSFPP